MDISDGREEFFQSKTGIEKVLGLRRKRKN